MLIINNSVAMKNHFHLVKNEFDKKKMSSAESRIERLNKLKDALVDFTDSICEAMNLDYGTRSRQDTIMADIVPCISNIEYTVKHLGDWMAPSFRSSGPILTNSKVEVFYQPKGVIGIVTPWNFPIMLSIGPLISAISAGNRAMIKMSQFTPNTNKVLAELLACVFDNKEVAVVGGESGLSSEFIALPFDHLLFTGSTSVGKLVMKAAADNLTPLTLELGGKSPAIVASDVSMDFAVERIIYGKSLNNGQACVAPDYVLVPEDKIEDFIFEYKTQYEKIFTKGVDSNNLTSVANRKQYTRILDLLNSEVKKGTRVEACHFNKIDESSHRLVTHLVIKPSFSSKIMEEEIFGPLLPIITYKNIDDAILYIVNKPKPLALYLMSFDKELQHKIKSTVHSGGMCINDSVFHLAVDDAPFGGIGESGKGNYHSKEGFLTFSHAKTVMESGLEHQVKSLFLQKENEFKSKVLSLVKKTNG